MSAWENSDSSCSNFEKEETFIGFMADTSYNTIFDYSNKEIDLFDIHYVTQAYYVTIFWHFKKLQKLLKVWTKFSKHFEGVWEN